MVMVPVLISVEVRIGMVEIVSVVLWVRCEEVKKNVSGWFCGFGDVAWCPGWYTRVVHPLDSTLETV